jgi:hypothetical protein
MNGHALTAWVAVLYRRIGSEAVKGRQACTKRDEAGRSGLSFYYIRQGNAIRCSSTNLKGWVKQSYARRVWGRWIVMVVLNRLKYCGKYKGKLSDVRPSYVYRDQGKRLGFPWIPLADSGLFNGLRGIQIKKFLPLRGSRTKLYRALVSSALDRHQPDPADRKDIT